MAKSIEEYTKEIEELKNMNDSLYDSLEKQSKVLLEKSIEFLRERIKYEIEYCVKSNTVHTKELAAQNRLKDVKSEMNKLLLEVPQYTFDTMSDDKVFIHRKIEADRNKSSYEYKKIIEQKFRDAYQTVVGLAGNILNPYGYIKVGSAYNRDSQWQYISGTSGKIKYGYSFDMRTIEDDWKEYTNTFISYYDNLLKYQSLLKSKEEAEAMDLWRVYR